MKPDLMMISISELMLAGAEEKRRLLVGEPELDYKVSVAE